MVIIIAHDYHVLLEYICALGIFLITLLLTDRINKYQLFRRGQEVSEQENLNRTIVHRQFTLTRYSWLLCVLFFSCLCPVRTPVTEFRIDHSQSRVILSRES